MILTKKPKILLIEDNLDDAELVKLALSSQMIPSDLKVVHDGEEALDFLLNAGTDELPQLVLLDLYLPKINGLEVLKELRNNPSTKFLPLIIFTSSEQQEDLRKSYAYGANAFIRKGLDPEEFKLALKNLDVYWLLKEA